MEGWHIGIVIVGRLARLTQLDEAVLIFLLLVVGLQRADGTVVLDRLAAQLQVIIEHALDKLIPPAPVRGTMLIFQIDRVPLVTASKQIAIGVVRADIIGRDILKWKHDGRLVEQAVTVLLLAAHQAQAHLRETQQGDLERLAQFLRPHGLTHADDVTRRRGQVTVGGIHKDTTVTVHIEQVVDRMVAHIQIHKRTPLKHPKLGYIFPLPRWGLDWNAVFIMMPAYF